MRHTRTWLFGFLPFLYLAIILGLVAIQFSKKTDTFSQSLGDLTISGKAASGNLPAEMTLKGLGLVFTFDANHSLVVEDSEGNQSRLRPLSWAWRDGNAIVSFPQDLQLVFEKANGGRSLLIRPVAPSRLAQIRIPFGAEGGTRLIHSARTSLVEVVRDQGRLLASVDGAQDRIDVDHSFVLRLGQNGFRPARLDPLVPGMSPEIASLTLDQGPDGRQAEEALGRYWDKAYAQWPSAASFSTRLVEAWGQEALRRGEYAAAFAKIQRLLDGNQKAWGFGAVAYLGNVVELTVQQRKALEADSSRSQPNWGAQNRLWLDARYYGPDGSSDRVKRLLLTGALPDNVAGLTSILENLLAVQRREPSDAVLARIEEVQTSLLTRVVRREGQVFVQSGPGLMDLKAGLILGRLWLDLSRTLVNAPYESAGARLILSALDQADEKGQLPEFLVTQEGRVVRQEGRILPEDVYSTVHPATDPETPLPEWGANSFVRTASPPESVKITAEEARFSFRFPTGSAEHVVIVGVPEFDHITLHGIRWRTDPQFQSYTDGWYYSASTKTLFLKIKHREDSEELIIHFRSEQ